MKASTLILVAFLSLIQASARADTVCSNAVEPVHGSDNLASNDVTIWHGWKDKLVPDFLKKTIVGDTAQVLLHGGATTNSESNSGIKAFVRDELASDDSFYQAAYRFYGRLRALDEKYAKVKMYGTYASPSIFTTIEATMPAGIDLHALALEEAHGDEYEAMKILIVYGHDDLLTELASKNCTTGDTQPSCSCKLMALDKLAPHENSLLYYPGALGGLKYAAADVKAGKALFERCGSAIDEKLYPNLMSLCRDNTYGYDADYYHVIAGAFLGCREQKRSATQGRSGMFRASFDPLGDAIYLHEVAEYKRERFHESTSWTIHPSSYALEHPESATPPPSASERKIVEFLLATLDSPIRLGLTASRKAYERGHHFTAGETAAAEAVLNRFDFEIDFRKRQHGEGVAYGRVRCSEPSKPRCK